MNAGAWEANFLVRRGTYWATHRYRHSTKPSTIESRAVAPIRRSKPTSPGRIYRRRPKRDRRSPEKDSKSAPENFVLRPLAVLTAILVAVGLVLGLPGAIRNWPSTWWPNSVAAVDPTILNNPQIPRISDAPTATPSGTGSLQPTITTLGGDYAVEDRAEDLDMKAESLPEPSEDENGCYSEARNNWVLRNLQAVPNDSQYVDVSIPTERRDVTVAIEDVQVHSKPLSNNYQSQVLLCPSVLGGGGMVFSRGISVEFRRNLPASVNFFDLDDPNAPEKIARLALTLTNDDLAQLNVSAYITDPGTAYEWWMTVDIYSGGERTEVRIPSEGAFRVAKVVEGAKYWSDVVEPHVCKPAEVVQRSYPEAEYWC